MHVTSQLRESLDALMFLTKLQLTPSTGRMNCTALGAGTDLVSVKGRGLDRLAEALDLNALEIVRKEPAENPDETENPIWVSSITISRSQHSANQEMATFCRKGRFSERSWPLSSCD
jgi:hypothetical protein